MTENVESKQTAELQLIEISKLKTEKEDIEKTYQLKLHNEKVTKEKQSTEVEDSYRKQILFLQDKITYELKQQYDHHIYDMIKLERNHHSQVQKIQEREIYEQMCNESKIKLQDTQLELVNTKKQCQLKVIELKQQFDKQLKQTESEHQAKRQELMNELDKSKKLLTDQVEFYRAANHNLLQETEQLRHQIIGL